MYRIDGKDYETYKVYFLDKELQKDDENAEEITKSFQDEKEQQYDVKVVFSGFNGRCEKLYNYVRQEEQNSLFDNNRGLELRNVFLDTLDITLLDTECKEHKSNAEIEYMKINNSFIQNSIELSKCKFNGTVSFNHTVVGEGNVDFSGAILEGRVEFRGVNFGKGFVDFRNAIFGDELVDFNRATFGDGDANFNLAVFENSVVFRSVSFGKGYVSFCMAIFSGDVNFNFTDFGEGGVTFLKAEFRGRTDVEFGEVNFGDGYIDFSEMIFGYADIGFREVIFGKGLVDFSGTTFGEGEVEFYEVNFGDGEVFFYGTKVNCIMFSGCVFKGYTYFIFDICNKLEINNSHIEKLLDLNGNICSLELNNVTNFGQINHDWKDDEVRGSSYKSLVKIPSNYKVKDLINKTLKKEELERTYKSLAKQFQLFKENFNTRGQYNDEDAAYYEYKHCMRFSKKLCEDIDKPSKLLKIWRKIKNFPKWLIFEKVGGYGTKPENVFVTMICVWVSFSFVYAVPEIISSYICEEPVTVLDFGNNARGSFLERCIDYLYYSVITFLTVGYGDIGPEGMYAQIFAMIESFLGVFLMAYFTVSFVRKLLR